MSYVIEISVFDNGNISMNLLIIARETLIKSLSDFTLEILYMARNNLTRIASYLRKVMTKLWIKILVKFDSAIESAVLWHSLEMTMQEKVPPFPSFRSP